MLPCSFGLLHREALLPAKTQEGLACKLFAPALTALDLELVVQLARQFWGWVAQVHKVAQPAAVALVRLVLPAARLTEVGDG